MTSDFWEEGLMYPTTKLPWQISGTRPIFTHKYCYQHYCSGDTPELSLTEGIETERQPQPVLRHNRALSWGPASASPSKAFRTEPNKPLLKTMGVEGCTG